MPELRVILLVVGVALIIGLWAWERRRSSTARAPGAGVDGQAQPQFQSQSPSQLRARDNDAPVDARLPPRRTREAPTELPVIQIDGPDEIDTSFASATRPEPADDLPAPVVQERPDDDEPEDAFDDDIGPVVESPAAVPAWSAPATAPLTGDDLVLDWPPEAQRRIVALRVVPRGADRLSGRSVRQALVGEGLLHGPMGIFHLPGEDGRVLLSAAGLTRPGTFQLGAMDTERYAGLSVFAVLPGALPADETFDRLIEVTRGLAARLNAELRDQRGDPLTTARVVALRAEIVDAAP
jgi:FtsZ-interacting cell division protein ZipA